MAQLIDVGGEIVEFPDDMPVEQIQAVLQQQFGGGQPAPQTPSEAPGEVPENLEQPPAIDLDAAAAAALDEQIAEMSTVDRALVGMGKQVNDVVQGVRQLFSDDAEAVGDQAAREQAIFDQLDAQGVGAEDAGQFLGEVAMMALPAGALAKLGVKSVIGAGALAGAMLEGARVSEGEDLLTERAIQAGIGGTAAAVGGAAGQGIGNFIREPVRKTMSAMTLGMSRRAETVFNTLMMRTRRAWLKDKRAQNIELGGRTERAAAVRGARAQAARENREAAQALMEKEVWPVIQTLNAQGKEAFMGSANQRFGQLAAGFRQSETPEAVLKEAWDQTFGQFKPSMLKRAVKDGGFGREWGTRIEQMGKIIANHSDKYSEEMIMELAAKAAQSVTNRTDKAILALAQKGVAESTLTKMLRAGGTFGTGPAIEALN